MRSFRSVAQVLLLTQLVLVGGQEWHRQVREHQARSTKWKHLSVLVITPADLGHLIKIAAIGEALGRRGHNVTLLTTDRQGFDQRELAKRTGMNYVSAGQDAHSLDEYVQVQKVIDDSYNYLAFTSAVANYFSMAAKQIFGHLRTLEEQWDVVIVDRTFYHSMYCYMKHYEWDIPMIVTASNVETSFPPWPYPSILTSYNDNLSFFQRLHTTVQQMAFVIAKAYFSGSQLFSLDIDCSPYYSYCFSDPGSFVPLVVFTVPGLDYPRPMLPLTHYVGPMIFWSNDNLSVDLQQWLEARAVQTVVYISMGSSVHLSEETGSAILNGVLGANFSAIWSLRKSNYNILEGLHVERSRVFVAEWLPQQEVLKSKAIALTISHGGMGGVSESLYQGVPLIVIPFGKDQPGNAGRVESAGAGVNLNRHELTAEKVREAIEIVALPKYRRAAMKLQKLFHHMGGQTRAAELVELYADVGYNHLVPSYFKYEWNWIQYYNLDVYAVLFGIPAVGLFLLYHVARILFSKYRSPKLKVT